MEYYITAAALLSFIYCVVWMMVLPQKYGEDRGEQEASATKILPEQEAIS